MSKFEVTSAITVSDEQRAAWQRLADETQTTIDNMAQAFSAAVDRAGMLLIDAGVEGVVAWHNTDRNEVSLKVDDVDACIVTGSFVMDDGRMLFNVETTWFPPYEHLGGK